MSDLIKGMLIGFAVGAVVAGAFIPMGEKKESLIDKIKNKGE